MHNTPQAQQSATDSKPQNEYRLEARAATKPGETEGRLYGGHIQLVRVVLSDGGPHEREDGTIVHPADVLCTMRPQDARRHAIEVLQAAERAERESTWK